MGKREMTRPTDSSVNEHARALSLWDDMGRWMDEMVPRSLMRGFHLENPLFERELPRVDVIDRAGEVMIRAAVPGFSREQIDVSLADSTVTIRGTRREEQNEETGDYHRHEIRRGDFMRTVRLPCAVDASRADARYRDGMLELTLPKTGQTKAQTVEIH